MSEIVRQAFGERVRSLRKQHGLSIRRLALMIGLDKGYVLDIEHGRRSPSLDTIEKIANGFDMTIAELCLDIDRPSSCSNTGRNGHFIYQSMQMHD